MFDYFCRQRDYQWFQQAQPTRPLPPLYLRSQIREDPAMLHPLTPAEVTLWHHS